MEIGGSLTGVEEPLLPVERGYRSVLRVRAAAFWGVLTIAAFVADRALLADKPLGGLAPVALLVIGLSIVSIVPQRIYDRLRYRLTGSLLQVMRGWLFHTDTVVPLVRVQHLDVVRGPLDKLFGTASLVVHTAGTLNSTVLLPGLSPERAGELRDTIREHVRTDFE
ncbi:MAG TPA: PH domain-containing protein [Sphingomicrobium sp.]|nr:PH domain-containing protein [Sphingomicrobium sp.]